MGTNFYLLPKGKHLSTHDDMDPETHLGKRSAAGMYCWDCRVTLCKTGEQGIHHSADNKWHDACPKCGKTAQKEELAEGAAGRELGFNKAHYARKTGVASCSSFTWAKTLTPEDEAAVEAKEKRIVDEYGNRYTVIKFKKMLVECPVQFFNMIGEWFG